MEDVDHALVGSAVIRVGIVRAWVKGINPINLLITHLLLIRRNLIPPCILLLLFNYSLRIQQLVFKGDLRHDVLNSVQNLHILCTGLQILGSIRPYLFTLLPECLVSSLRPSPRECSLIGPCVK
ncbi:uncharacterized protein G2W53_004401 [Senna tora]|uniref:Uncharacterized protein n=1 Tax=Senna tora TaxID=362788 RepID=A0A834XCV7_9FABA|nr:uncharacterized protein G2W53_004401 [Senna tora]